MNSRTARLVRILGTMAAVLSLALSATLLTGEQSAHAASWYCPESSCQTLSGSYTSHFTGANCSGTEVYYTAYFAYDGLRRSWDGGGIAGGTLHTYDLYSLRTSNGTCENFSGPMTLSNVVIIYRLWCGEFACTGMTAPYISHYTGSNCDGAEYYYTGYFGYDGSRRSWDGHGIAGTSLHTITAHSYRTSDGTCYSNAWGSAGNTLGDFVAVYR